MILKRRSKHQVIPSSLPASNTQILTIQASDTNLPSAFSFHTNVHYSFDNIKTEQNKN